MKLKTALGILGLFLISMVFFQSVYAEDVITNRTGTIKITRPDGTVLTVGKDEPLPDIPSGSIIEVLDGSIDIAPTTGFVQLIVGDSAATVKAGDSVSATIDLETGMADFKTASGEVNIVIGNTTATVKAGQEALMGLDRTTGEVSIKSVTGAIETVTAGVKAEISNGAAAKITADATTRNVHVESVAGDVQVTTIDGEVIVLAEAESIDTEASPEGEIQTFAEAPEKAEVTVPDVTEEPAEPEPQEGSPYMP